MTALKMALGGFLVVAYLKSGTQLTPILAVNIGVSAPVLLGALPRIDPGKNIG